MTVTPCDTCPAHCCREPAVDLTIPDIFRITRELNLTASDFAQMPWMEEPEPERRIVRDPEAPRYYRLRLIRTGDKGERRCIFLHDITPKRSVCSIYPSRPETCRAYPTYISAGGLVGTGGGKFCPPDSWTIEMLDVRQVRTDWTLRGRFRRIHDALVDGWNERVFFLGESLSEDSFFGFVTSTCRDLEALAPDIFRRPEAGSPFDDPEWPDDRITDLADTVLRAMGWRTDETAACARPELGREPAA